MSNPIRFALAAVHVVCIAALWNILGPTPETVVVSVPAPAPDPLAWLPVNELTLALDAVDAPARYPKGGPGGVHARAAILADLDRGEVLWTRRADIRYPVASLTKLTSALAMVSLDPAPALEERYCLTPELWPVRPGATSRFETGHCYRGWDFLGTALVHSDNRGAMGMTALAGVPFNRFIEAMDEVSADLDLSASWSDPTGLDDNNMASARDMLKIVVAVAAHPMLANVASAPTWMVEREDGPISQGSTNRLKDRYEILSAKTGYTDTAGYNFTAVLRTRTGRLMGLTVLGSRNEASRFADAERMLAWADQKEATERKAADAGAHDAQVARR